MNLNKSMKSIKLFFLLTVFIGYIYFFFIDEVVAIDIKNWLINNKEIMQTHGIFKDLGRNLAWFITKGLAKIALFAEDLFNSAFTFIDLSSNSIINDFIANFKLPLIGLVAISLGVVAYQLLSFSDKKPNMIVSNICIFIVIVFGSTIIFQMGNELIKTVKVEVDKITTNGNNNSIVYEAINDNTIDLVHLSRKFNGLDKVNYKDKSSRGQYYGAGIKSIDDLSFIELDEVLNTSTSRYSYGNEGSTAQILGQKLYTIDLSRDIFETSNIDNGWGYNSDDDNDLGNEFYYRYHQNTFTIWILLFSILLVYLTMAYKVVRTEYELVVSRLLSYLYASELSGGERVRKILSFARDSYILLFVSIVSIKLFKILISFLSSSFGGEVSQGFFTLFVAFCIIDGPNIVEKILGVDAGLRSSTGRMLSLGVGFWAGTKGLFKGSKLAGKSASSLSKATVKGGKGIHNAVKDGKIRETFNKLKGNKSNIKSSQVGDSGVGSSRNEGSTSSKGGFNESANISPTIDEKKEGVGKRQVSPMSDIKNNVGRETSKPKTSYADAVSKKNSKSKNSIRRK